VDLRELNVGMRSKLSSKKKQIDLGLSHLIIKIRTCAVFNNAGFLIGSHRACSVATFIPSKSCPFSRAHVHLQGDKDRRLISNHGATYRIGCYKWRLLAEQCAPKRQKA
jgi:hypothetical protein